MAIFAWIMMGIALWHFAIWIPDRFWGGIVGTFIAAAVGAVVVAWLINGLSVPSRDETTVLTALEGIPGALIGTALMYAEGVRRGIEPLVRRDREVLVAKLAAHPEVEDLALSPNGVLLRDKARALKDAGVGSLPGTSAEILDQEVRDRISPGRITRDQWIEVITTAHRLGIRVTIEGVETEPQFAAVQELGSDFAQGYLLHRPLSAEAISALFTAEDRLAPRLDGAAVGKKD